MKLQCNIQSVLHINISNHSLHRKCPGKSKGVSNIQICKSDNEVRECSCFYMTELKASKVLIKM